MRRIELEERARLEEEAYRRRVREALEREQRQTRSAAKVYPHRHRNVPWLLAVYVLGFLLAAGGLYLYTRTRPGVEDEAARARIRPEPVPAYGAEPVAPVQNRPDPMKAEPAPAPAPEREPEPEPSRPSPVTRTPDMRRVNTFLDQWVSTLRRKDLNAQAALYAPVVERFYRRSSVPRQQVIAEKRRMLDQYPDIRKYEIRNVNMRPVENGRVSVTFDKEWDTVGRTRFTGAEKQRLVIQPAPSGLEIVREEELAVYRVKR